MYVWNTMEIILYEKHKMNSIPEQKMLSIWSVLANS